MPFEVGTVRGAGAEGFVTTAAEACRLADTRLTKLYLRRGPDRTTSLLGPDAASAGRFCPEAAAALDVGRCD